MKKTSSIDKVVGKLPDAEKQKILKRFAEIFNGQSGIPRLHQDSCSKTMDQLKIIAEVNEATNVIRRKHGLEDFDATEENVHIIKKEVWSELGADALFIPATQSIFVKETKRNIRFAVSLFRVMAFLKSYGAVRVTDTGEMIGYRRGLIVETDGVKYLEDMNETVIEELTKRYVLSQLENPLFKKELEETREIKMRMEESVTVDEKFMVRAVNGEKYDIRLSKKTNLVNAGSFTHQGERMALATITYNLFERSKGKIASQDAAFDMFVYAMFTGHLSNLARVVNKYTKNGFLALATPVGHIRTITTERRKYG